MNCPAPFFIWFHHRSGSSHLCSLLDSHSDIACWGEFFFRGEADASADIFSRSRSPSEAQFLGDLYSYRWNKQGAYLCMDNPVLPLPSAVGFKLKYQQASQYPDVVPALQSIDGIKVIHLVRNDLLSAIVSAEMIPRMLKKFRRPNLLTGDCSQDVQRKVRLNCATLITELEELEARIKAGRQALDEFRTLEITYEDLLESPQTTMPARA